MNAVNMFNHWSLSDVTFVKLPTFYMQQSDISLFIVFNILERNSHGASSLDWQEFDGTYFPRVFSTSVSLIIWYLLNVLCSYTSATSFRVQPRSEEREGGRRVVPKKRKCVGGLVAREKERREREERRETEGTNQPGKGL